MSFRLPAFLLAATALQPAHAAPPPVTPAPLSAIAAQVALPFAQFTLPNGLRVVVSTDHGAPLVAVQVWYHVGSKDEPAGKTGFAHLFEHLMFYGSENVPGGVFGPLEGLGGTDINGSTYFDRTNYFETVPTPALPMALFLESDRMGHLLGAVGQQTLDRQRGVVQNEKREDDNQPLGLTQYSELRSLFPETHPYHHSTIGSMADLDRASLEDVRGWFRGHYGPNNAVLVLAGDVTLDQARTLATRYFGDLPRGPQPVPTPADVPTLPTPRAETLHDQIATVRIQKEWAVPGITNPATVPLDLFASVLGGLASSRFDDELVRRDKLAVSASAQLNALERVGIFEIDVDVKPGVDPALVRARVDAILADLIARGPTADELQRAMTHEVSGRLYSLEQLGGNGGRAATLATGALYAGDPGFFGKQLAQYAAATPETVRAAAARWLTRPAYDLTVLPGAREAGEEARAIEGGDAAARRVAPAPVASGAPAVKVARTAPPVGEIVALAYPPIVRTRLSNGIPVVYARRGPLPLTRIAVSFDAGHAADPRDALGTENLMLDLLDQGTRTRTAGEVAADEERLGIAIDASGSIDRSAVTLSGLSANLAPGIDLLADALLEPSFADLERVRVQQLAAIDGEINDPTGLAARTLPGLIYGRYPYGVPASGSGDPAVVRRLTRADLLAFKAKWIEPGDATIFVVSDRPLAEVQPLLERRLGRWHGPPPAAKDFTAPIPAPRPHIVLLDRPGAGQSVIYAGAVLGHVGTEDLVPLISANDALGGTLTSRLSVDLRETRNWAYGVGSGISQYVERVPFRLIAPVQADRTGAAIQAAMADMAALFGPQPITDAEREHIVERSIRELPGNLATGNDLIGAMQKNDRLKRPDDFYAHLADHYRALTTADLNTALRAGIDPHALLWVVVGDAAKVKPQLDAVGLPVEMAKAPAAR